MSDLTAFAGLVPLDHGLVVVSTARADGTVQSSVVNALASAPSALTTLWYLSCGYFSVPRNIICSKK